MTAPSAVYPYSTRAGDSIPVDIIEPTGLIVKEILIGSVGSVVIPDGVLTGAVMATVPCILVFSTVAPPLLPVDGTVIDKGLFIPKDFVISTTLKPGTAYIVPLGLGGTLYIQMVEKWASLALDQQFKVK